MIALVNKLKAYVLYYTKVLIEKKYRRELEKNKALWNELNDYLLKSKSTGCSYCDYWEIYSFIRKNKPEEILECGTGVSTIIMAHALIENAKEGFKGRVTSMESKDKYYELAKKLLPEHMTAYVDLILSPVVEDQYSLFRGVRYKDVPMDREYDFVYIDGPSYVAPSDGTITFDFDYFHVVKHSDKAVHAIIDKRVSTCYVFQKIFGSDMVRYSALKHLGFAGPCTKADIKHFDPITPSAAFHSSFRLIGNSVLKLKW